MSNISIKRKQTLVDGKITDDYFVIRKENMVLNNNFILLRPEEFEELKEKIKKYE